ncbi:MAG: cellulase family glycosylhydrolase [Anaerolineae bacterium]|nr:cellulase family glycosylhydrolase [Anaerolineae bacterium]
MQSPFLQNIGDIFSRLRGRALIVAVVIWVVLIGIALSCTFGVFSFGGKDAPSAQVVGTATPVNANPTIMGATQQPASAPTTNAGGFITLSTPTTVPSSANDATPGPTSSITPLSWGEFGYGIAAHSIYLPEETMQQVKDQLGLTWIKQQIRWDHFSAEPGQMDWSGYDPVINAANAKGLKVMLSVVGGPDWARTYYDNNPEAAPPDDLTLFAQFLGEMIDRYQGKIHAIEVWNEQNLDREWDNAEGVNATRYVELLRLAYQAIKARDPNIIVISGALSPTGSNFTDEANPNRVTVMDDFTYFQQMVDAGFLNYVDCIGAHHNGINMPPDVTWNEGYNDPTAQYRGPFDNPHHSWSFKSTLWGYHEMAQNAGYSTPLCITEFGWATAEGFEGYPPGFEFALDNTLAEQALWDVQAFQLMRQWGFVHLAFLWNLDYSVKGGSVTDPNAPYSLVDMSGAPRPAFGAIAEMPKVP